MTSRPHRRCWRRRYGRGRSPSKRKRRRSKRKPRRMPSCGRSKAAQVLRVLLWFCKWSSRCRRRLRSVGCLPSASALGDSCACSLVLSYKRVHALLFCMLATFGGVYACLGLCVCLCLCLLIAFCLGLWFCLCLSARVYVCCLDPCFGPYLYLARAAWSVAG